ncbi:MAG: KUP/HAK/KT family potassium transporter [Syntrophales bacterium]|nr:KUP/HAK/KT family potassium transporter [Syntrophales bacterium]MDD5531378.1 KUP/HAK/KT family potassium transporter [Syntrophales bacterium]
MKSEHQSFWGGIVKAMGLVFGDVGTSPIYTLTVVFALTRPTEANVFGIISLVFWTMTILVTVEYAWLAMSLSRRGQGGEIVLREIIIGLLKKGRLVGFAGFLTYMGVSLLVGDGVITPAISILSAVEGMVLIPGLEKVGQDMLIFYAAVITLALFIFQSRGSERVAVTFGPIMLVWFISLAVTGLVSILDRPDMVRAIDPRYALRFFETNGIPGFFVLSEVILCATGGEALYADMGHLGRAPILRAWLFVFIALFLSYLGQGVFVLTHPGAKSLLFEMVRGQAPLLYIPFLLLTVLATIVASQAIISGVFSIVYQGITTRLMPLLRIRYTSSILQSQIYIPAVNWLLMFSVLMIMLIFRESSNLAAAYGLAVTGSMTITCILMIIVFSFAKKWKVPIAAAVLSADLAYLTATFSKIPEGAYWSLILAAVPLTVMTVWTRGQRRIFRSMQPLPLGTFLISYEQVYAKCTIPGTALFFTRQIDIIPPYVTHCIIGSQIVYERNILISIAHTDEPYGVDTGLRKGIGPGLDAFEVRAGYMEVLDIEALLKESGIQERIIFYGIEDITTRNPIWKLFSNMKKLTPNFVQFHKLPARKLHGVITRIEI